MSILLDGGHLRLFPHGMLGKNEYPRRLWQIRGAQEASTASGIFSRGVSFLPTCGKTNSFRYKDLALAHGVPFIPARGEDEPRIPFRGLRAGPARSSPVCFRRSPQTHPNDHTHYRRKRAPCLSLTPAPDLRPRKSPTSYGVGPKLPLSLLDAPLQLTSYYFLTYRSGNCSRRWATLGRSLITM